MRSKIFTSPNSHDVQGVITLKALTSEIHLDLKTSRMEGMKNEKLIQNHDFFKHHTQTI